MPREGVLDDGDERERVERLRDRVHRAGLVDELTADLVALRAHEHDGQALQQSIAANFTTELIAVHFRHHEIREHQVDLVLTELSERIVAVLGRDGLVTLFVQDGGYHLADGRAVVDDEDACAHRR